MNTLAEELREIGRSLEDDIASVNYGYGELKALDQRVTAVVAALSVLIDTLACAEVAKSAALGASSE